MKRFQALIVEAKAGLEPWIPLPEAAIPKIAAQCGAADIADIIAALDDLAKVKQEVSAYDGDAQDDIGKAQELFARILGAVPKELAPVVAEGLDSPSEQTREWVRLALAMRAQRPPTGNAWERLRKLVRRG